MKNLERTELTEMNHLMNKVINGMKQNDRDMLDNQQIVSDARELSDMLLKFSNYIVTTYIQK